MHNKLILTDADGVLLDWCFGFDYFMEFNYGHKVKDGSTYSLAGRYDIDIKEAKSLANIFNVSVLFQKIPPMKDAIKYVRKLHEKGYVFHVITSACPAPSAMERVRRMREYNLERLFGTAIFETTVINFGESKREVLEKYKDSGCFWIEDHPENYDLGEELGLNAVLFKQSYNADQYSGRQCVSSWKEIYDMVK